MPSLLRTAPLLLALVGCSDLLPPPGVDPYEYRIPDGPGGATMSFHWPRESLPITVYVADDNPLRPAVRHALDVWQGTFVYGEVRFETTADSTTADIIVSNDVATKPAASSWHLAGRFDGCLGQTDFDADPAAGTLRAPFRVRVWSLTSPGNPALADCFEATVLHEIGHALGIFAHSPYGDDVMYVSPSRRDLSPRDRATIEAAYHLPSTLRLVR